MLLQHRPWWGTVAIALQLPNQQDPPQLSDLHSCNSALRRLSLPLLCGLDLLLRQQLLALHPLCPLPCLLLPLYLLLLLRLLLCPWRSLQASAARGK